MSDGEWEEHRCHPTHKCVLRRRCVNGKWEFDAYPSLCEWVEELNDPETQPTEEQYYAYARFLREPWAMN